MVRPVVSVIIPAYRAAAYVSEALDSVLSQADARVEVIVVNDGSPDTAELESVLEPYRDRIVYVRKENGGVSSARNAGILEAGGEWLAFLDADDLWMPHYLESQQTFLREHPGIQMVFPDAIYFGDSVLAGRRVSEFSPRRGEADFLNVVSGEYHIGYCALVRRETVVAAGLFPTNLRGSEDFNLWLRILKCGGRIAYNPEPLYRYRRHDGSLTSNRVWMAERVLESLAYSQATIPMSDEEHAAARRHRRGMEFEVAWLRAKDALHRRDWQTAIECYEQANALRPNPKLRAMAFLLRLCPALLYNVSLGRQKLLSR